MRRDGTHLAEKVCGHFVNAQSKEIFDLGQSTQHSNTVSKADHNRNMNNPSEATYF